MSNYPLRILRKELREWVAQQRADERFDRGMIKIGWKMPLSAKRSRAETKKNIEQLKSALEKLNN